MKNTRKRCKSLFGKAPDRQTKRGGATRCASCSAASLSAQHVASSLESNPHLKVFHQRLIKLSRFTETWRWAVWGHVRAGGDETACSSPVTSADGQRWSHAYTFLQRAPSAKSKNSWYENEASCRARRAHAAVTVGTRTSWTVTFTQRRWSERNVLRLHIWTLFVTLLHTRIKSD